MRYTYKFVNGESISVEVSEEMEAVCYEMRFRMLCGR